MAFDNKFLQGMLTGAAGLILVKKFFFHHSQTHHHGGGGEMTNTGRPVEHDLGEGYHECECGHQGHGKWHGTHETGLSDII